MLALPGIRDDHAMRIDDHTAPGVEKFRFAPHAIHAHDVSLVFNRPRLEQREPMLLPFHRPQRHHHEEACALVRRRPEDFRKAQVVADERRDHEPAPLEGHDLGAGLVRLALRRRG